MKNHKTIYLNYRERIMDDSSIQYRIRLAQINGIKLDEAKQWHIVSYDYGPHQSNRVRVQAHNEKDAWNQAKKAATKVGHKNISHNWTTREEGSKDESKSKGPEFLKKQDDSYHNMERASAIQLYHDEMRNNIRNGLSSNRAHKEAMNAVENEHGKSGIDHLHGHFSELELNRNSEENK